MMFLLFFQYVLHTNEAEDEENSLNRKLPEYFSLKQKVEPFKRKSKNIRYQIKLKYCNL